VGHLRLYGGGDTGGWLVDTLPADAGTEWSYSSPALVVDPTGRLHWFVGRNVAGQDGKPESATGQVVHLWRDCEETI
jgi:hypothetical protein